MSTRTPSTAIKIFSALVFGLAIAGPLAEVWRGEAGPADRDGAARYVDLLEGSRALRDAVGERPAIGYASDDPIDLRVGGPAQARYYLSQYALAPLLLELETSASGELAHDRVLLSLARPETVTDFLRAHDLRDAVMLNANIVLARKREPR